MYFEKLRHEKGIKRLKSAIIQEITVNKRGIKIILKINGLVQYFRKEPKKTKGVCGKFATKSKYVVFSKKEVAFAPELTSMQVHKLTGSGLCCISGLF